LINELLTEGAYDHDRILYRDDLEIAEGGINTDLDRTSVGGMPQGWDTVRLKNITKGSLYGVAESAQDYDPESPRYIRITDISEDGRLKNDKPASLPEEIFDKKYFLAPGELLFARTGATVGKTYLFRDDSLNAVYGGYLIRFVPDPDKVIPEYLFYYTQSKAYANWVTRVTRKGAQENINAQEYSSILLPLPPINEQEMIVDILETHRSVIDREISFREQLIRIEQGLMQELISGELRTHDKDIEIVNDVLAHG
jgi:type I restriction enzyme S subunit